MQKIILIAIIICFCHNLFAQTNIYLPLGFASKQLANKVNIDEDLYIFLPDTINKILFNPSIASQYSKNCFYVNYFPKDSYRSYYNTSNEYYTNSYDIGNTIYNQVPTVSIFTLLNKNKSKWLIEFDNVLDDNYYHDYGYTNYSTGVYKYNIHSIMYESDLITSITRLKISKIRKTNYGGYGLGIWGIYSQNENNGIRSTRQEEDATYNYLYYLRNEISYFRDWINYQFNNSNYSFGLDISFSGKGWDFIQQIGYTKSFNKKNISKERYSVVYPTESRHPNYAYNCSNCMGLI